MNSRRLAFVVLSCALFAACRPRRQRNPSIEHRPPPATVTPAGGSTPGTDANDPVLPFADKDFVDTRGGAGWSDRCWTNIKAKRWGYARAECDRGMAMNPASPQPRASLLYNEGLIAEAGGDLREARRQFEASLALREHPEVRAALRRVSR